MTQEEIALNINYFFLSMGISLLIAAKIKSTLIKAITGIIFIITGFILLISKYTDILVLFDLF